MPSALLHDVQEVIRSLDNLDSKFGTIPKAMNDITPIHLQLQCRCYKLLAFLIGLPLSKA